MARVELEKVSKIYAGGVKAVNAIDLSIKDQEFVVLVGPSGCGKSNDPPHGGRPGGDQRRVTLRIGDRVVNDVAAQGPGHRHGVPELRPVPAT